MGESHVEYFEDMTGLGPRSARFILDEALSCVREKGLFSLVLAGGSTPIGAYELLAREQDMPWEKTHVFFGDERCVPPDDPRSNFLMAEKALLSRVALPKANIHRIQVEKGTPGQAAKDYEQVVRKFFDLPGLRRARDPVPAFDLILLGMGSDGHTASLFPGSPECAEAERLVVAVDGAQANPPLDRISMTFPLLNAAGCVLFLIAGPAKKRIFQEMRTDPAGAVKRYPAALVRPRGRLFWFVAEEA
ncbi:MAG: 6-phosphogluconolactonase [Thermodesulfobacteriota bacterium]|nr:6-phosphogluconolactonase [Thermodesulfobacteriota bacterium]